MNFSNVIGPSALILSIIFLSSSFMRDHPAAFAAPLCGVGEYAHLAVLTVEPRRDIHLPRTHHRDRQGEAGLSGIRKFFHRQLQESSGNGYGLKFCARPLAAFRTNGGGNRSVQVHSGRTPAGVGLGELGHSRSNYGIFRRLPADYQSACTRA